MGDSLIEKIIILTSPVGLIVLLIGFILDLWERYIWCNKRWYFNHIEYIKTKRMFNKGLEPEQLAYFKRWVKSFPDDPNIEKYKKLISEYKPESK
jgi:hypothetical protein